MSTSAYSEFDQIAAAALETAERWAKESNQYPVDRCAKLLAEVLEDPSGLDYTVSFVDDVIRPEDTEVAAKHLGRIGKQNPKFLPWYLRSAALVGGSISGFVPQLSVPAARKVFARLVGDLVVNVSDQKLGPAISRLKASGARLNMNLLGEAVLGNKEAQKRLDETRRLLERPDVDYVSLKVSAVTGPHNPWGYDRVVSQAVEQLLPLYQYAANSPTPKFINLDMEEYHDLHLTIDVFKQLLDKDELLGLEAGIVLQAYLPDSLAAMKDLQHWSAKRCNKGGSPIKVRVVKGANLAMEKVDALMHGWPNATWDTKQSTDANYLRILDWAMHPERAKHVRLGVAGHNLFTVAAAWELARKRKVTDSIEFEMLSGMATQQASAVGAEVGNLLLYVPVVDPAEYDVAIAYLVRRLEENSAAENFMASIFEIGTSKSAFTKEQDRFLAAVQQLKHEGESRCQPNRQQNRLSETGKQITAALQNQAGDWQFANTPDSDPALPDNLTWAKQITRRVPTSTLGEETVAATTINSAEKLKRQLSKVEAGARTWQDFPLAQRVNILHQAGVQLAKRRGELIEVAAHELGKSLEQADVEVSEAIDFAHYYAEQALELPGLSGAKFSPVKITLVTPPWNFPLAIPAGGTLAALAAGSAVVLKPASVAKRCAAVLAECLWEAGVPKQVLSLVNLSAHELGKQLVSDPRIDRVVLTGGIETAQLFRSWDPTLNIMAETSGKNAIIITPSADLDLAVKDVVQSAFGHAGQKCSACSYVILVGSAGFSARVRNQLLDAVSSLHIGWGNDLSAQMGPLSTKPGAKLLQGLTQLGPGEKWELKPRPLDESGRLWSPGVRSGVEVGSQYHLTEYFGPILGIMRVKTLDEAIEAQNLSAYGLTAGLHSLDPAEINHWLNRVQAGNLYVNRGITGAIVRRQPFGGWKRSSVGEGAKAGGPNYLFGFGTLTSAPLTTPKTNSASLEAEKPQLCYLLQAASSCLDPDHYHQLAQVVQADELVARSEFDRCHDPSALPAERNLLRYLPTPVTIRLAEGSGLAKAFRILSAALAVGKIVWPVETDDASPLLRKFAGGGVRPLRLQLSVSTKLPDPLQQFLDKYRIEVFIQTDQQFLTDIAKQEYRYDQRIRLIGSDGATLRQATGGAVDVAIWDGPLTNCSRVEILPFVQEQAIAITNHRFGNRTPLTQSVLNEDDCW